MQVQQSKTSRQVIIPLNENAITILSELDQRSETVFSFPSDVTVRYHLKKWAEKAGLKKHVTFGVARHSFVTGILIGTGILKIASNLAGHSSITMTERYAHILDEEKRSAVNLLGKRKNKKRTGYNKQNSEKNIK